MTITTREITIHRGDPVNDRITLECLGEPAPDGAKAHYRITYPTLGLVRMVKNSDSLFFQRGPTVAIGGVEFLNGLTNEALLAVLIDRLEGFQQGPFACDRNDSALGHLKDALADLKDRTRERQGRGVLRKQEP